MVTTTILAIVTDLMFQSRLREQAQALGHKLMVADTESAVREALATKPSLVILDLHASAIDWRSAIGMAKQSGVPVLAFGRHTEAQLLRAARDAGCDRVVARSTLFEELPQLIEQLTRAKAGGAGA